MDKCSSDAEFDSYWDYEAKNKNRNRIRVGRQYQATVPPLLKPGEKDNRKCEDLETLKWKPDKINDQEVDQYLSMARAVSFFAKAVERSRLPEKSADSSLQAAFKGLSDFVTSHHPCHHDAGCQVSKPSVSNESTSKSAVVNDWSPAEAQLFAQALGECGKNFCAIKKEFLPWKPVRSIIEYYYNGKGEKHSTDALEMSDNPSPKSEKSSCDPSCSHEKIELPDTKEEQQEKILHFEDLKPVIPDTSVESKGDICKTEPVVPKAVEDDPLNISSTVGSLKFFLGGRLVLKLNAQQDNVAGTKCQWVQSNDTPRHSLPVKKMKHRKKTYDNSALPGSEKLKKKVEDQCSNATLISESDSLAIKKAKLKSEISSSDLSSSFPLLYSTSWTPPVADGQESVELDDGSSKTSEGYISPVLLGPRSVKIDAKTDTVIAVDSKNSDVSDINEPKTDHKSWVKPESYSSQSESNHTEEVSRINPNGKNSPAQFGEETICSLDVLSNKCALNHNKLHIKNISFVPRTAHSSSPVKSWNRWPSTSTDYSEKTKLSPDFHSPNSVACSTSPESSVKDFILDLSSKPERCTCPCENQDLNTVYENCCQNFHSECAENCSSSEESLQACCNSSNDIHSSKFSISELQPDDNRGTTFEMSNDASGNCTSEQILQKLAVNAKVGRSDFVSLEKMSVNNLRESSCLYSCCIGNKSSCTSPKCPENCTSIEHSCKKDDDEGVKNSNHSPVCTLSDDVEAKKSSWYGAPVTSFLQIYPQCYPYYLSYSINPATSSSSSATEIPLDLSSASGNSKEAISLPENVPETDLSKKNTDAVDRGMLYQLLKSKITK